MGAIQVLSIDTVNKIAAGEVVERPASAVKELVENSLDAGASSITVEIQKGGVAFIRVTDNGSGIAAEDVETAFLPHSTSKIASIHDLEHLYTMGFRGEALASIASVAKVELLTKTKEELSGTALSLEGGKIVQKAEAGCPDGTTIVVRDLFYNTPARMNFMKKDATEAAHVTEVVEKLILARPDVSFRLIHNGRESLFSPGTGSLKDAVTCIYGKEIASKCVQVDYTYEGVQVQGLAGLSSINRPNRSMQYFYVNGRYVKSKTIMSGAEEGYRTMMMVGKFPVLFLKIALSAAQTDVNVHPQKLEIKFSNDRLVHDAVFWAVQNALFSSKKDKEVECRPQKGEAFKQREAAPLEYKPKKQETAPQKGEIAEKNPGKAQEYFTKAVAALYETPEETVPQQEVFSGEVAEDGFAFAAEKQEEAQDAVQPKTHPSFRVIGQLFDTYIIFEMENKMFLIDQHAAHERIKYEEIVQNKSVMSQALMLPEMVKLTKTEGELLKENLDVFENFGFAIEEFGTSDFIVRQAPGSLPPDRISDVIVQLLELVAKNKDPQQLYDKGYFMIACKSAIKANHSLSPAERETLVRVVLENDRIRTCPHGRPVMISFSKQLIEKEFKRIV